MQSKILIYRLGSLGDSVLALPTLHALRNSFGTNNLTLLTNIPVHNKAAAMNQILGNGVFVKEIIAYYIGDRNPSRLYKLIHSLRKKRFHYLVNLTPYRGLLAGVRDQVFFRIAGIRTLIGCDVFRNRLLEYAKDSKGNRIWEAEKIAGRLNGFVSVDLEADSSWDLMITPQEKGLTATYLKKVVNKYQCPIAFSVGTKVPAKDWGIERWTLLFKKLHENKICFYPVFFGSSEDRENSDQCLLSYRLPGLNLCGKTNPRASAWVMRHCNFFVGLDSGPMHLASAVGLRCLAIFSDRNAPKTWYPRGGRNVILQKRVSCGGCNLDYCITENLRCLNLIRPEEVFFSFLKMINNKT